MTTTAIRIALLSLLTLTNTVTILSLRYSRTKNADNDSIYFVTALILTMESIKFIMNLLMLLVLQMKCSVSETLKLLYNEVIGRPYDTAFLAIPSSLYILQDNLIIFALSCLDAGTYQVTYQLRILTTALFARLILRKQLTNTHWLALVCLMIGVILTQLNFNQATGGLGFRTKQEGINYFFGLWSVCCATLTSGFAGVYNEKLLKDGQQTSLFIRSIQLSLFSILFAVIGAAVKDGDRIYTLGFFHGFGPLTWFIAVIQAVGGVIVAATMKYADNILKTFATSISIVLSCILSYAVLGDLNLAPTFIAGTVVIISATALYAFASQSPAQTVKQDFSPTTKEPSF